MKHEFVMEVTDKTRADVKVNRTDFFLEREPSLILFYFLRVVL
jgi:hypothetical protein